MVDLERARHLVVPRPTCLAGLTLAAAIALFSRGAGASLLDEPPKVCTFRLGEGDAPALTLLRAFQNAEIERPGPFRQYFGGRWGSWRNQPWQTLAWLPEQGEAFEAGATLAAGSATLLSIVPEPAPTWLFELDPDWAPPTLAWARPTFASNGFDALWAPPPKPPPRWRCKRSPVTFARFGAESDTFALVQCDGSVAPEALDRLSIIARPPEAPDPGELLPDEPDPDAWRSGEWVPQVRLAHSRLLWVLQRVADAFPRRAVYVYSGYRPKSASAKGSHGSLHAEARAMDIKVMGVANSELFLFCRTLEDVGCGYYPNSKFVHVDVRRPGKGKAFWIDVSAPGEPSRFVDAWPGVVESGGLSWSSPRPAPDR